MRLRAEQLAAQLERGLAAAYLLSGDEPLQRTEAGDAIRARARGEGYEERQVFTVEPGFDWGALAAATQALSLFAERKLIELRIPGGKPGAQGAKVIEAYCADPPHDTVLLIETERLDRSAQASAWVKAVEKLGVAVQFWPLAGGELLEWIEARMRARGLAPDASAVRLIAERVEGNLLACAQEIDKLSLLHGSGAVDAEAVLAAVADSARYSVYDLADAALAGQAARGARILQGLRGEGVDPVLVLWALSRELHTLVGLAEEAARGAPLAGVTQAVWPERRRGLVQRALARQPVTAWRALLGQCARADRVIKGQAPGKGWDELLQLVIGLSGEPLFAAAAR